MIIGHAKNRDWEDALMAVKTEQQLTVAAGKVAKSLRGESDKKVRRAITLSIDTELCDWLQKAVGKGKLSQTIEALILALKAELEAELSQEISHLQENKQSSRD